MPPPTKNIAVSSLHKQKLDSFAETGQFCKNWTVSAIFSSYWFGAVRKFDLLKTTPKILKLCRLVKNHKLNYSKK